MKGPCCKGSQVAEIHMFSAPHRGGSEFLGVCSQHLGALTQEWRSMGEKPMFRHRSCGICEFANGEMTRRFHDISYLLNLDQIFKVS